MCTDSVRDCTCECVGRSWSAHGGCRINVWALNLECMCTYSERERSYTNYRVCDSPQPSALETLETLRAAALGLAHMHAHGFVHGDVSWYFCSRLHAGLLFRCNAVLTIRSRLESLQSITLVSLQV